MKTWVSRLLIGCVLAAAVFGGSLAFAQAMDSHTAMGESHGMSVSCAVHCLAATLDDESPAAAVLGVSLFVAASTAVTVFFISVVERQALPLQPIRVRSRSKELLTVIKRE